MKFSRFLLTSALCISATLSLNACETMSASEEIATSGAKARTASRAQSLQNVEEKLDRALEEAVRQAENAPSTEESLRMYEELLKLKPGDPVLATKYARKLREDKQLQKSEKVLSPFVQGEEAHPAALTEMAKLLVAKGDYAQAEILARKAINKVPENGQAYLALGTALDAQGNYSEAETAFKTGVEYWKGDPAPIMNNYALNLASQGKLEEALIVLTRAREISPHRMEIERNYRIIATLLESVEPPAPKPFKKPEPVAVEITEEPKPAPKVEVKEVPETKAVPPKEVKPEVKTEAAEDKPLPLVLPNKSVQSWKKKSGSSGND